MSEVARKNLEQQVLELADLLQNNLFSKVEVRDIVLKRSKFEHQIRRRQCDKKDFLVYIDYERSLEDKRLERMKELGLKKKHSVCDHSIRKRIFSLYQQAVMKNNGDVDLWLKFLDYCELTESAGILSKQYSKYFANKI